MAQTPATKLCIYSVRNDKLIHFFQFIFLPSSVSFSLPLEVGFSSPRLLNLVYIWYVTPRLDAATTWAKMFILACTSAGLKVTLAGTSSPYVWFPCWAIKCLKISYHTCLSTVFPLSLWLSSWTASQSKNYALTYLITVENSTEICYLSHTTSLLSLLQTLHHITLFFSTICIGAALCVTYGFLGLSIDNVKYIW